MAGADPGAGGDIYRYRFRFDERTQFVNQVRTGLSGRLLRLGA